MEGLCSLNDLQALSALLNPPVEDDDEDCADVSSSANLGPGHIGPAKSAGSKAVLARSPYIKNCSNELCSEAEVSKGTHLDDITDLRPQPDYDIVMKQRVGTEDIFLGMSGKDPSSMCCESIVVKIKLPSTKLTEVALDVKEQFLDLSTPKYRLGLHLPHPVHSQEGTAQFSSEKEELEVTLPMNRPTDYINLA